MIINTEFLLFVLILGALLIYCQITLQMRWYKIAAWKSLPVTLFVILTGLAGSYLWFFIENGYFSGRSLYGAVFLCPIVFSFVAKMLKIQYGEVMDVIAPAGCFVLGLAKVQCMRDHCCEGKVLFMNEDRVWVRFPSQIVEGVVFIVIAVFLLVLSRKKSLRTMIYPIAMIIYGIARFFLDFLRDTDVSFLFGLSRGSFWSLCSLIIGIISLVIIVLRKRQNQLNFS